MYPSGPRPIHGFVATVDGSARLPVLIGVPSQSGLEILRVHSWGEIRPGLWPPICSVANTKFWESELPVWWCMASDRRVECLGETRTSFRVVWHKATLGIQPGLFALTGGSAGFRSAECLLCCDSPKVGSPTLWLRTAAEVPGNVGLCWGAVGPSLH